MEVLKDFVMPVNIIGSKLKSSKYLTMEQYAIIKKLEKGQAVILPFIGKGHAKIVHHRINMTEGIEPRSKALVDYAIADLPENGGCAVKRITDQPKEEAEKPAEQAEQIVE